MGPAQESVDLGQVAAPHIPPGQLLLAGLRTATEAALAELSPERAARDALILRPYLDRLDACLRPWEAAMATAGENFRTAILAHLTAAEALCATDTLPGEERLWAGPAGEAAADFLSDLVENAGALVLDDPSDYPALLMSFMGPVAVRQARPARSDDSGGAQRGHLARRTAGRSVDVAPHAPAVRPARAGAANRPFGP